VNQILSEFTHEALSLIYQKDEENHVGLLIVPQSHRNQVVEKDCRIEPLVQCFIQGDNFPTAFSNGHTSCGGDSTMSLRFVSQKEEGRTIVTTLQSDSGRIARHYAVLSSGCRAVECFTEFENQTGADLTLEMLSSSSFGSLTPFDPGEAPEKLKLYTATSSWSNEGRLISETIEEAGLEPSWSKFGCRVKKIGQKGSLPVRGYFPFMGIEDTSEKVSWAFQVAWAASWQMESRRQDNGLSVNGGLMDFDTGHWSKTLKNGESFRTPSMYAASSDESMESAMQMLLDLHERNRPKKLVLPPVMYNEYCTTWGVPSHDNLSQIVQKLKGKGMEYLVIDAGWYKRADCDWSQNGGDWEVAESLLFPKGFAATVNMIRENGMVPGLWFEAETCGPKSHLHDREELLLHRNGRVIDTGSRRFLDMRKPEAQAYVDERIIALLKKYNLGYIKVDYNDCIGVGADDPDSLGEGLRRSVTGSQEFYRRMRRELPDLVMENCSSGGHRLEPSMMGLFDMASFSDAHECVYIPIIAANLHRLILPSQSQIWCVLHGTDSLKRTHYSMVNTFLGVMCLSGDIYNLSEDQWNMVDRDISFYRKVRHIIGHGTSQVIQKDLLSYTEPKGWQTVIRTNPDGESLVVLHTFGSRFPDTLTLPVKADGLLDYVESKKHEVSFKDGRLTISGLEDFEALAFYLK